MTYNFCELSRAVVADEALTAALYKIEDAESLVGAVLDVARGRDLAISDTDLRNACRPDPVNVRRFMPRPADGATWPPAPWLPVYIGPAGGRIVVDWAFFGAAPLTEPFFESSIRRAMRQPFNRMFAWRMTLEDFLADAPRQQSLAPDGFIFHMSRCGSTLAAQMLAALPDSIVISEAAPIDVMVQLGSTAAAPAGMLRAVMAAYGRRRSGNETRFFIKLDCWHAMALPLFRAAFTGTPWTFLYRDPVEVLVSHQRRCGGQMVPDITPAALYGIEADIRAGDPDYCARALAAICAAAADNLGDGSGVAINYRDLPEAVAGRILPHFGSHPGPAEGALMDEAARRDAKAPHFPFADDSAGKQDEATPALRAIAESRLEAVYHRLEGLRQPGSGAKMARRTGL